MNIITICSVDNLHEIINHTVCLSGAIDEEIGENMWCISLDENCMQQVTGTGIIRFFDRLVIEKTHQIRLLHPQMQAILYVWFDRQALQLRLNILSGASTELPFQCRIQKVALLRPIVDNFLSTVRSIAYHGEQVEFIEPTAADFDDDDEQDFILDVYVMTLNAR